MRKKIKLSVKLSFCVIFSLFYFSQTIFVQGQTSENKDWSEIASLSEKAETTEFQSISQKMVAYRKNYIKDVNSISYLRATFLIGYFMDKGDLNKDAKRYYSECLRHPMIDTSEASYSQRNIKVFAQNRIKAIDDFLTKKTIKQTLQKITASGGSKSKEQERLPKPIELSINQRELLGAETHRYQINLINNEFLQVIAEQKGIDILLKLIDSKGNVLATMDTPNGKQGTETLSYISQTSETYTLEVSGLDAKAAKGLYSFQTEQHFPATDSDKKRVEVEKLFVEGVTAKNVKGQEEIAVNKLEEALKGWRELKDEYLIELTLQQINQLKTAKPDNLFNEGLILYQQGAEESYRAALVKYKEATLMYQEIGSKSENAGIAILVSGIISYKLGEKSDALKFYDKALTFFLTNNFKELEATTLNNIGAVYADLNNSRKAIDFYEKALALIKTGPDKLSEAATLNNIGLAYSVMGEYQKALGFYLRGLPISQKAADKSLQTDILTNIGGSHSALGKNQKALEFYQKALILSREINDKAVESTILNNIGAVCVDLGENQKALHFYTESLYLTRQLGEKKDEVITLNNIGTIYSDLGENNKAKTIFEELIPLFRELNDKFGEANNLNNLGNTYLSLGENQQALEMFQQAVLLKKENNDIKGEMLVLSKIGKTYTALGEKEKSLQSYQKALYLFDKIEDKKNEASILINIGEVYFDLGKRQKAIEFYQKALILNQEINEKNGQAIAFNNLGLVYSFLGEKQKALGFYQRALFLFQKTKNKDGQASTFINFGEIYSSLTEKQKALGFYQQALHIFRGINNKKGQAVTFNNLGKVYADLGENQKAIEFYEMALTLYQQIADISEKAYVLNNIGEIYLILGEKQKAKELYQEGLFLFQKVNDKEGKAFTINNFGLIYSSLGEYQKAKESYQESFSLFQEVNDKAGKFSSLNNLGVVYSYLGEYQKALECYKEALSLNKEIKDRLSEATTLINIGDLYGELGDKQKTLYSLNQSLSVFKIAKDKNSEAKTFGNLAFLWKASNNPDLAIYYGKQSIKILQELRFNIKKLDKDIQHSFLKSVSNYYSFLAELLLEENRFEESLQVLSLYKEEEFLENYRQKSSTQNSVSLSLTEHEKVAQARYQVLSDKLSALGSNITKLQNKQPNSSQENQSLSNLQQQLNAENENLQKLLDAFAQEFSKKSEKNKPLQVPEIKVLQNNLKELNILPNTKAAAIYTLIGEEKFYTLLVTDDKHVIARSYPIKKKDFLKKVEDFRGLLQNSDYDPQDLASELYQIILKPIEKELDESKANTLMWSLDGQLRYLPPAALFDVSRNEYLVQRYRNVLFTPAGKSDLNTGKTTSQVWTGLGAGVSEKQTVELYGKPLSFSALTNVLPEIRGIIKQPNEVNGIYGGKRLENPQFSSETFKSELQNKYQLVHVSSHFYFNYRSPIESFLLTGTGKLSLSEVFENPTFFDGVELLTLSACETAIGNTDANGKEIEGFAVLAQQRGAKAIMATLWSVADESTAKIMQDFYRTYNSSTEMSKAEAIRLAQLKYLKETDKLKSATERTNTDKIDLSGKKTFTKEKTKHPYFWAPFILYGNWK